MYCKTALVASFNSPPLSSTYLNGRTQKSLHLPYCAQASVFTENRVGMVQCKRTAGGLAFAKKAKSLYLYIFINIRTQKLLGNFWKANIAQTVLQNAETSKLLNSSKQNWDIGGQIIPLVVMFLLNPLWVSIRGRTTTQ